MSFLVFKGSPESKDGDEEMKQTLARLERRLEALTGSRAAVPGDGAQLKRIWSGSARTAGD